MSNLFREIERKRIEPLPAGWLNLHRNIRVEPFDDLEIQSLFDGVNLKALNLYPEIERLNDQLVAHFETDELGFVITSGIDGGIKAIFDTLVGPTDSIAYLSPSYFMYEIYPRAYNIDCIRLRFDKGGNNFLNSICDQINILPRIPKVVFISNPNLPYETYVTPDELFNLSEYLKEFGSFLCVDEAYFMFGAESCVRGIPSHRNLIVARTFSKGYGLAGIRVGYLVSNLSLASRLNSKRLAHEISSLSCQIAINALLKSKYFFERAKVVANNRDKLLKQDFYGVDLHGGFTNTVMATCSSIDKKEKILLSLDKRKFRVRSSFENKFSCDLLITVPFDEEILSSLIEVLADT